MKKGWLVGVCMAASLVVGGCCNSSSGGSGGELTGQQAVERLKAKGWTAMMEPVLTDAGSAKSTTFMSGPPKVMTMTVMEYTSSFIAKAAYEALKDSDPDKTVMYGDTVVTVTCAEAANCKQALDDIKP